MERELIESVCDQVAAIFQESQLSADQALIVLEILFNASMQRKEEGL
jgi:hypothetical protein